MYNYFKQKGVSPIIGVILLVALTVALVSLATVIVFNLGNDANDTADVTIDIQETNNGLKLNVIRNENVESIKVQNPDDSTETFDTSVGSTHDIRGESGYYSIVAVLSDGSEEVIKTTSITSDSEDSETLRGTVSINPDIEGAIVQSIEDGFIIDETTTDENGEYTIEYREDSEILVIVDGFEGYGDNPLYASAVETDVSDNMYFEFDSSTVTETTVDDETVNVTYGLSESDTNTIATVEQLQAVNENLDADYEFVRDIGASGTETWNLKDTHEQSETVSDGDIVNLDFDSDTATISITDDVDNADVEFDVVNDNTIEINDVDADNTDITVTYDLANPFNQGFKPIGDSEDWGDRDENEFTGNLDGQEYEVDELFIDRPVEDYVGLFGGIKESNIKNIGVVNSNLTGASQVGGLVGENNGEISESYSTGSVTGEDDVGGLVGENYGPVINAYSTGNVTDNGNYVGGLVGYNAATVSESYSTSSVNGNEDFVGGLVGYNTGEVSEVSKSYATGSVTDNGNYVGGLVGWNEGKLSESYSTGSITGGFGVGGLVGLNDGDVSESYWDTESSGQDESDGGTGLETDKMTGEDADTNMSGFDFTSMWSTVTDDYPTLQWQE